MVGELLARDVVRVRAATVPEEHDGAAEVVGELLEKPVDLGPADVDFHEGSRCSHPAGER